MKVSYSYLPRQFSDIDDLLKDIKKFVKTGDFTLGKPLEKFEKKFAKLMGSKHAIGVNSGTDAIKLSLNAFGVGVGDEVITAANTFVATVGAINELGAKPVFVDWDDTFCMNVDLVEKAITNKTKAIVPVHFTGYMTNMKQINKIKEKNKENEMKLLKIEINSLKLKNQRLNTKLQNIQNILNNKSIDVLHSVI